MKQCDFQRIENKLADWRKERHILQEQQRKGLLANILEELTEYERANLSNNTNEIIDSLCDIATFTINANIVLNNNLSVAKIDYTNRVDFIKAILENINNKNNILAICFDYILYLGYDPYKCMGETIMEISSRVGKYDESIGKFVKEAGFYSLDEAQLTYPNDKVSLENNKIKIDKGDNEIFYQPLWYKADYQKCKL